MPKEKEKKEKTRKKDITLVVDLMLFQIEQLAKIHEQLVTLTDKETETMANIEEVKAAVANVENDVTNVQRVLGELNDTNAALVQQVADLQEIIANGGGVTAEQLQEVADRLASADAALDSLAPDAPNAPNEPV